MALFCVKATAAEAEREFRQTPRLVLPFYETFEASSAGFPEGWNGHTLDADHHFRVIHEAPVSSRSEAAAPLLEAFSKGVPQHGRPPVLYLIIPKHPSLCFRFDFYYKPETNYFRAGVGDSGRIHLGIQSADQRFFLIWKKDGEDISTAIPAEYLHPGEWNRAVIGFDSEGGYLVMNGHEMTVEEFQAPEIDYVRFVVGHQGDKEVRLLLDNIAIHTERIE